MRIVEIEWVDSRGVTSAWEHKHELEPLTPVRATSVGFVLDETKNYITLVQSISADQILGRITIPREAIKKIRKRS